MTAPTATIEALREGRNLLATPGVWVKHVPDDARTHCAITAMPVSQDHLDTVMNQLPYCYLRRALPAGRGSIAVYNDDPDTTLDDVLALYDRAIAEATRG